MNGTPSKWRDFIGPIDQHVGPLNWYRLQHPFEWRWQSELPSAAKSPQSVSLTGTVAEFAPPNGSLQITVRAYWGESVELADEFRRLWPDAQDVEQAGSLDRGALSRGVIGRLPSDSRHLDRPVCQLWQIRHDRLGVVVGLYESAVSSNAERDDARRVLKSVEVSDHPVEPLALFADRVVELARERFPLLKCHKVQADQVLLGESSLNLFNFYKAYASSPDQFEQIVLPALTTIVQVGEWGKSQTEPDYQQVRSRILPMLYPEQAWQESLSTFVGQSWIPGLCTLYVVDEPRAYYYIPQALCGSWGITAAELHQQALVNLDDYFSGHPMEYTLGGEEAQRGSKMLLPNRPDAYNSVRILSNRFREKVCSLLDGPFVVGIPSRDFLVAVSDSCDETIAAMADKVEQDYLLMDHPLTDQLYHCSRDGVSLHMMEGRPRSQRWNSADNRAESPSSEPTADRVWHRRTDR